MLCGSSWHLPAGEEERPFGATGGRALRDALRDALREAVSWRPLDRAVGEHLSGCGDGRAGNKRLGGEGRKEALVSGPGWEVGGLALPWLLAELAPDKGVSCTLAWRGPGSAGQAG